MLTICSSTFAWLFAFDLKIPCVRDYLVSSPLCDAATAGHSPILLSPDPSKAEKSRGIEKVVFLMFRTRSEDLRGQNDARPEEGEIRRSGKLGQGREAGRL